MIALATTFLLALVALPLILALVVFCLELLAGLAPLRQAPPPPAPSGHKAVVLMPAHDEAKIIAETIHRVLPALGRGMELLVIADNCRDETAAIAREAGAGVTERHDPDRRGKGYALAHGLSVLAAEPPDCVIVVDADAWPQGEALQRLVDRSAACGRPIQACFLIEPDRLRGPLTRVSNFAHMLMNRVRQRGVARLAGTAFLCGSGMAFPWPVIRQANLANGEIVEDLVLGIRLALAGNSPLFEDDACILSRSAPGDAETRAQRRRWEHGFMVAASRFAPPLLRHALVRRAFQPLWMALHLMVPPLVLLVGLSLLCAGGAVLAALAVGVSWWIADGLVGLTLLAGTLVTLAWWREGRSYLGPRDLLALPLYLASKLAIWAGVMRSERPEWNRTDR